MKYPIRQATDSTTIEGYNDDYFDFTPGKGVLVENKYAVFVLDDEPLAQFLSFLGDDLHDTEDFELNKAKGTFVRFMPNNRTIHEIQNFYHRLK